MLSRLVHLSLLVARARLVVSSTFHRYNNKRYKHANDNGDGKRMADDHVIRGLASSRVGPRIELCRFDGTNANERQVTKNLIDAIVIETSAAACLHTVCTFARVEQLSQPTSTWPLKRVQVAANVSAMATWKAIIAKDDELYKVMCRTRPLILDPNSLLRALDKIKATLCDKQVAPLREPCSIGLAYLVYNLYDMLQSLQPLRQQYWLVHRHFCSVMESIKKLNAPAGDYSYALVLDKIFLSPPVLVGHIDMMPKDLLLIVRRYLGPASRKHVMQQLLSL